MFSPPALEKLINEFARLPGIGRKTARRLAYYILQSRPEQVREFSESLLQAKERIRPCARCFQYAESEICPICANPRRDQTQICVVEKSSDIEPFESSGSYRGLYHVLGGVLSPLDGIGPEQLHLPQLIQRVSAGGVNEVILALGSSPEADATVLLIDRMLGNSPVQRTRLARGIPMGSDLEFVDEITMLRAFEGRVRI